MNKLNIEKSIRLSIAEDTPDLFDRIIAEPVVKLESEDYIVKSRPAVRSSHMRMVYAFCTSFALLFAICFGLMGNYNTIDSIIAIDVNPSVQIVTNKSGKVLNLKALNEDGAAIISNIDYKNKNYNVTVKEVINTMAVEGYIDEAKNSVLVSVSSSNENKADVIKTNVVTDISDTLTEQDISAMIYNQSISDDREALEELAVQYGISFGKMKFISGLVMKDPSLSIEELAKLSLQDISNLIAANDIDLNDVVDCNENNVQVAANQTTGLPDASTASEGTTSESDLSNSIPKTGDPDGTTIEENSTNSSSTTSSNTPTTATESGVAIVKAHCSRCSSGCTCSQCSTGCKANCPNCDKNCSNNPGNNSSKPSETTTEEDEEITDPDDTNTSGTGGSTEDDLDTDTSVDQQSTNEPSEIIDEGTLEE